jgi:hypothetical protein
MIIIFLDVDGVLNTNNSLLKHGWDRIDPDKVAHIAAIVKNTAAEIVISSTWRLNARDLSLVHAALAAEGLEIFDTTPEDLNAHARYVEIKAWLDDYPEVTKFAIIDDDPDAADAEMQGSFFQTNADVGLTAELAEDIIKHLND